MCVCERVCASVYEYVCICECMYVHGVQIAGLPGHLQQEDPAVPAATRSPSGPFLFCPPSGCPSGLSSEVTSQDAPVPRGGRPCSVLPLARAWRHPLEMGLKEERDLVSLVPCGTLGSKTGKFTGHQNTISPLSGAIPGPRRGGLTLSPSEVIPMEWPLWWWPFTCPRSGGGCGQWPGPSLLLASPLAPWRHVRGVRVGASLPLHPRELFSWGPSHMCEQNHRVLVSRAGGDMVVTPQMHMLEPQPPTPWHLEVEPPEGD